MVSKIVVKNIGIAIKNWGKNRKFYSEIPNNCTTFDVLKGVSNKGDYKIFSFRDNNGTLVKRITSYPDKDLTITKDFAIDDFMSYVHSKTLQGDKVLGNEYKTLVNYSDGSVVELTEKLGSLKDAHQVRYLKPHAKPRTINIEDLWGNPKFTSPNCSTAKIRMLDHKSYFPIAISNASPERVGQRINYISELQRKKFNINTQDPKRVDKIVVGDFEDCLGCYYPELDKVEVLDKFNNSTDLLYILGHEYRHAKDIKDMSQYVNGKYYNKKRTPIVDHLCREDEHYYVGEGYENQFFEDIANSAGKVELNKLFKVFDSIVNFFYK